ncbi:hypothetical protein JCM10207_003634 [Rhodosporidiobolus poonsookiae]
MLSSVVTLSTLLAAVTAAPLAARDSSTDTATCTFPFAEPVQAEIFGSWDGRFGWDAVKDENGTPQNVTVTKLDHAPYDRWTVEPAGGNNNDTFKIRYDNSSLCATGVTNGRIYENTTLSFVDCDEGSYAWWNIACEDNCNPQSCTIRALNTANVQLSDLFATVQSGDYGPVTLYYPGEGLNITDDSLWSISVATSD